MGLANIEETVIFQARRIAEMEKTIQNLEGAQTYYRKCIAELEDKLVSASSQPAPVNTNE